MVTVLLAVGGDVEERARPDGDAVEPTTAAGPAFDQPLSEQPSVDAPDDGDPEPLLAAVPDPSWQPPTWEQVVTEHGDRVFRLAYRLTGNKHDAEDLTQEVFVRVFRSLSDYTPGNFEGWLHRITTNLFLDGARRKQRIRFDALSDDATDRLASKEPQPEQDYEVRTWDHDVQAALESLSPEFRAAVVLCDV